MSDAAIKRRVSTGRLYRVHRGVYAVGRPAVRPLERASAAVLACGRGAILSHLGAAKLWGFVKHWPRIFDVTVPGDRRPKGVRTHRSRGLSRADRRPQLGIWVTSPARTLLDCAPLVPAHELTRLVNDALLSTHVTSQALAETLARFPKHPGTKLLRPFLEARGGPTRSGFEDFFKAFCQRYGLPEPIINTRVAGHDVDALFAHERLIVELDSWEFHSGRAAFENDRDREPTRSPPATPRSGSHGSGCSAGRPARPTASTRSSPRAATRRPETATPPRPGGLSRRAASRA